MKAILSALATANPKRYATQEEIYHFMAAHFPMEQGERELYRQLLLEGPIRGRYISVDEDEEICSQDADFLISRFARHSRRIAAQAAEAAMTQAGLDASQIEALDREHVHGLPVPGPVLLSRRGPGLARIHGRAGPHGHGLRRCDPQSRSRLPNDPVRREKDRTVPVRGDLLGDLLPRVPTRT